MKKKKALDKRLPAFVEYLVDQLSASSARTYGRAVSFALRNYPDDPEKMLTRKNLTKSSRHTYGAALRRWAEFTKDKEMAESLKSPEMRRNMKNALREEHRTHTKHDVQPFTSEEEKAIYGVLKAWKTDRKLDSWQWPGISMMFNLGLRAGADLAWLAKKDVEAALKSGTALVIMTKGSKERELPAALVMEELRRLVSIKEEWAIFADLVVSIKSSEDTTTRVKNAYERIRRCVKTLAEEAGIPPEDIHTHRLRHNAAQRLYAVTKDIRMVQKFLGHESYNTTLGYLKKNETTEIATSLLAVRRAIEEGED